MKLKIYFLNSIFCCWTYGSILNKWNNTSIVVWHLKTVVVGPEWNLYLVYSAYKIDAKIIQKLISTIYTVLLSEMQNAFWTGRSSIVCIYTQIHNLLKNTEMLAFLIVDFVDYERHSWLIELIQIFYWTMFIIEIHNILYKLCEVCTTYLLG